MQDMINRYDLGSSVIRLFFCPFEWQSELPLRSCTGHIECYNKNMVFAHIEFLSELGDDLRAFCVTVWH